jgi:hypothetical protein
MQCWLKDYLHIDSWTEFPGTSKGMGTQGARSPPLLHPLSVGRSIRQRTAAWVTPPSKWSQTMAAESMRPTLCLGIDEVNDSTKKILKCWGALHFRKNAHISFFPASFIWESKKGGFCVLFLPPKFSLRGSTLHFIPRKLVPITHSLVHSLSDHFLNTYYLPDVGCRWEKLMRGELGVVDG